MLSRRNKVLFAIGFSFLASSGVASPQEARKPATDAQAPGAKPAAETETKPAFLVQPYLQLPMTESITVMWETTVKLPSRVEFGVTPNLNRIVEAAAPVQLHEVTLYGLEPATAYHYRVCSGDLASEVSSFRTAPTPG